MYISSVANFNLPVAISSKSVYTRQRIQGEFNLSWVASVVVHALTQYYGYLRKDV